MIRWVVAPLLAAFAFVSSGLLGALETTTERSAALARASRDAPKDTRAAAGEVVLIPDIAAVTTQQADAFKALADALDLSAERVFALRETLDEQATQLGDVKAGLRRIRAAATCVERRLAALGSVTGAVPSQVNGVASIIRSLVASQDKSLRHLKSINRKLTALGVAARAQGVEPPPSPDVDIPDLPGAELHPLPC